MNSISFIKREILTDLEAKFPNPTPDQRAVISAVKGVLSQAERRVDEDFRPKVQWIDDSIPGLSMRIDSSDRPSPRPRRMRRDSRQHSTVDDIMRKMRDDGWKPYFMED